MERSRTADVAEPRVTAWRLLRSLRAFSLPASMLPVLVAVAAAASPGAWRIDVLVVSTLGAGLLHLGGNLLNDYFDYLSGVDRRTEDDTARPGRLLVRGELCPSDVLAEALGCLGLAGMAAAYLVWRCDASLLWFLAAALVGVYAYTGPPFRLKYRALGEPLIFVVFGPLLMAGAAWAQTGRLETDVLLLSIPVGLMTTAILIGDGLRDRQEDAEAGILTLAQFAGGRLARTAYLATPVVAVSILAVMGMAGSHPRLLVFAPIALVLLASPLLAVWQGRRLPDIDARTARFEMVVLAWIFLAYLLQSTS